MPRFTTFKVKIQLPIVGGIEGTWEPDEEEEKAAWEMYVELVTRISIVPLRPDEGVLREALSSLYSLFGITRQILREHGPSVAQPKGENDLSFGYLSVAILNTVLRPLLAKWHPLLKAYEDTRPNSISFVDYERKWEKYVELRQEIEQVRIKLIEYANLLAQVARVPLMVIRSTR